MTDDADVRRLLRAPGPPLVDISDDTPLTQYGVATAMGQVDFRGRPRGDETGLSLIVGKVDAYAASILVRQHAATGFDAVRYTRAGLLREEGFTVVHDPVDWNGIHALVHLLPEYGKWETRHKTAFKRTFRRYLEEAGNESH